MLFIQLTLFRTLDARPAKLIHINVERIQCLEFHETGSRIQFHLNEPSLYTQEPPEEILTLIKQAEQNNERHG